MVQEKNLQVYLILVLVMIAWGFNVTATKIVVSDFMPVTITAFRVLTAGIGVFIILAFLKGIRLPTKKEFGYILVASIFNVVGHHYFLSLGLLNTSASNGGLIIGMGPLITTILAIIFLGSIVTAFRVIGIVIGIIGVSFIVLNNSGVSSISLGDIYVFLAIFSQALSFIIIKKISGTLDPRLMTAYMLTIGAVFLFFISLVVEPNGLQTLTQGSASSWFVFFASAFIATSFGQMMYNYAIGKVGAAESSMFINLCPFFALVGAALFLGEKIFLTHILGFIFILCGVLLGTGSIEEFMKGIRRREGKVVSK